MSGNIAVRFSEGMPYPTPFAPSNLDVDLFLISFAHKSSFLMTSGQCMPMMDRRHLLTKDCSLLEVAFVTLHVSDPYRRADFTLVLNIRSWVFLEIVRFSHRASNCESSSCLPDLHLYVPIRPAILADVTAKVDKVLHFLDVFPIQFQPVCITGVNSHPLCLRFADSKACLC